MITITIAFAISAFILMAGIYVGICFIETYKDLVRLVIAKGMPIKIQPVGWGFIWRPIQEFYDYTRSLLKFNLKEGEVTTMEDKGLGIDENVLLIDSGLYLYFVDSEDSVGVQFECVVKLWERGLQPLPGDIIDDAEKVKDLVEPFVHSLQREIAKEMTWHDVRMTTKFIEKMQDALNNKGEYADQVKNPFVELGIKNIRYIGRKIRFADPKMEKALYALAVANQEGQATIKLAEDEAAALEKIYAVIKAHPEAAALRTLENTGNHWVLPFDISKLPQILGGTK